jgi:hypothetical protein
MLIPTLAWVGYASHPRGKKSYPYPSPSGSGTRRVPDTRTRIAIRSRVLSHEWLGQCRLTAAL